MSVTENLILDGGRVVDPANGVDQAMDIGIEAGRFAPPAKIKSARRIKVKGLVVAPGFIDMHVHLRQPGGGDRETIRSGTMAAAVGGFTTVVAMPNTSPPADSPSVIEYIKRHTADEGVVNVLPTGCVTKGMEGKEMSGIGGLKKAGVVALTDDGKCVQDCELMRHVLEYSKTFGLPILDHCEEETLSTGGLIHEGFWSALRGLRGIPSAAEELIVARDIILARMTGWRIHIQHISAKESVALVRDAIAKGVAVSAEATPHHIALTDECVKDFDTHFKMNPPLRSEDDRRALIEGLKDGTIAVIATDHAPHTDTDKLKEFDYAPFGVIGLETAVPVCLAELVHTGYLTLSQFVAKFTSGPAGVLGLDIGSIREGQQADLTVLDTGAEHVISSDSFLSKSRNTPFEGRKVLGKAVATIVAGKPVFSVVNALKGLT